MNETGIIIRKARKAAKLTQNQLADASGTDGTSINRIETGYVIPKAKTLEAIAKVLGCEAAALFGQDFKGRDREIANIGAKIRAMRIRKGLQQKELAKMSGYTKGGVTCWESRNVMPNRLQDVCKALGCTVDELDAILDTEPAPPKNARREERQHVRPICASGCTFWRPMTGTRECGCHWGFWHDTCRSAHFTPGENECKGFMDEDAGAKYKARWKKGAPIDYYLITNEELAAMKAEQKRIQALTGKIRDMAYHNRMG